MLLLFQNTKTNLYGLLILVGLLIFSAVSRADDKKQDVRAVVLKDFPPLYQVDQEGLPEGFAIDLLEEIARRENLSVTYTITKNWFEAIELIRSGEADVIPGIGRSLARQKEFVFSDIMESIPVSCFVKYGNKEFDGIESLANTDIIVGVIASSAAQTRLESMGGYRLKVFDSIDPALNQLLSGEIEAFVFPEPVLKQKLARMTISGKVDTVGDPLMFLHRGYMLAEGNDELLTLFNHALDKIMSEPFYAGLYSKWYGHPEKEKIPGWIMPVIGCLLLLVVIVLVFNMILRHQVKIRAEQIMASHKFVNNLLESTECIVLVLSEDHIIKYGNIYSQQLFGYSEEEMLGKNALDLLVPEVDSDGQNLRDKLQGRLGVDRQVASHINQNVTKDGRLLWIVWTNNVMKNVNTGEDEIVSIGFDITTQKEAEDKLRQAQQELEIIVDNMAGSMVYLDNDLNVVRVNKETERIIGQKQEQIVGKKCYEVLCNRDEPCPDCSAMKAMESGKRSRNETFILLNGRNYDVISTPLKDSYNHIIGTISIMNDVTRRRQLENNLNNAHEALERYTKALENKVEAGNVKLEKREEDLREAQNQLIQAEKMASLGRLIAGVGHEINSPLGAIKSSGEIIHEAFDQLPSSLGSLSDWLQSDQKNLFYDMLKVAKEKQMVDMSSRERRERRSTVMSELEKIGVANSFEMAQKLVDIGLYENVSKYEEVLCHPDVEQRIQILQNLSQVHNGTYIISWAVEKAHNIVFALKNYIHTSSVPEKVSVNLKENIMMVLVLYQNQIKHGVEVELELDNLPDIIGFAGELNQIWSNLISNALQAMDYQGNLTIKGRLESSNVVLSFTDTGCGIPDEIKETIFEPLFTTKPLGEGTGIGLDIVNKIVKKHGGIISIESQPGEGATFTVSLPISQETSDVGGAI